MEKSRLKWDEYFIQIAQLVSQRSTCIRRHVGVIIVNDRKILTTGYNGSPTGLQHCKEIGCLRSQQSIPSGERHELCRGLHGEQNAIIQAALCGVSIKGGILYSTNLPCSLCAKMLVNAEIKKIIYCDEYKDELSWKILKEANIPLIKYELPIISST